MTGKRKLVIEILGDAKDGAKALLDISDKTDRMAQGLQRAGTAGIAAGMALGGGLLYAATQAADAETQQLKLDNSIANSSNTFRNNGQALKDLATAIQSKTAADGDAIVGMQSLLVQYGYTENQILSMTPLVVDLSRKMGIDLDAAAKAVAKSADGSATALKRMGIDVDEAKMKADPFTATMDALRSSVGGFAEAEGETAAGKLERIKNQLGDIVEGVGAGAIDTFSGITDKVAGLASELSKTNPELLNTAGRIGAIGSVAAIGVGGLMVGAGWLVTMRDRFTQVAGEGENATRKLNAFGRAAAGLASVTAVVGIFEGVAAALNDSTNVAGRAQEAIDRLVLAMGNTKSGAGDVVAAFGDLVGAEQDTLRFQNLWQEFGAEVSIVGTDVKADVEQVQRAFDQLGQTEGPNAQIAVLDALEEQTRATLDSSSGQYRTNMEFIDRNRAAVEQHMAATAVSEGAIEGQTGAVQEATSALESYTSAVQATTDPLFAVMDAQDQVTQAKKRADEAMASGDLAAYQDATIQTARAQATLEGRLGALQTAVQNGTVSIDVAKNALDRWVAQGVLTRAQADAIAWGFGAATHQAQVLDQQSPHVSVASTAPAVARELDNVSGKLSYLTSRTWIVHTQQRYATVVENAARGQSVPGLALGGPVAKDLPYIVGEEGWELFIPDTNGTIISHNDSKRLAGQAATAMGGSSAAGVVNITVNYSPTVGDPYRDAAKVAELLKLHVQHNGPLVGVST